MKANPCAWWRGGHCMHYQGDVKKPKMCRRGTHQVSTDYYSMYKCCICGKEKLEQYDGWR